MSNKNETPIVVGQTLYAANSSRNSKDGINAYTVTKVGKKYIYTSSLKINIETLQSVTDYTPIQLYVNEQELLDKREKNMLYDIIRKRFDYIYRNTKEFPLEQLREVTRILNLQ